MSATDVPVRHAQQAGLRYVSDDTPGITLMEVRSKARRFKSQNDLQLIVIDYLQLMKAGIKTDSREQEISEISRSLKGLAKELKIPVIGIVDTNCDPDEVDYVIPGNDDALRSIRLFASKIADAIIGGRQMRESRIAEEDAQQAEEAAKADQAARLRSSVRPQRREAASAAGA